MTISIDPSIDADLDSLVDLTEAEVLSVACGGWRVSDLRIAEDDSRRLLGFVETRDSHFQVMRIGVEFTWATFSTMADALTYLLTIGRQDAALRSPSRLAWIAALPQSSFPRNE